jgi:CubicO group peptidase (beta-lactamase class C family)
MRLISITIAICTMITAPVFADKVEDARAVITRWGDEGKLSGTVLVAKGEDILFTAAYGEASKRYHVPNTLEMRFNVGSMNKMMTATAIMQLVEAGKLSLTDTLDQHLDETWLPHAVSHRIRIEHLLTHASGLGSYFTDEFFNSSLDKYHEPEDFKPLIVTDAPKFEPGTGYRYSNNGMMLLGAVIAEVSGQSYFDYIDAHIYAPAGMTRSGCFAMDQPVEDVAMGYEKAENETGWINNSFIHPLRGGAAGGCFSTVGDLHKFALALTNHTLLTAENTERLYTAKPEFHLEPYGYGFKIVDMKGEAIVGHSGGFTGISGNLDIYLKGGYIVAVLSNYGGVAQALSGELREVLTSD